MKIFLPWLIFLGDVINTYRVKRIPRAAAEFAYFFTLTIFPLLIIALRVLADFNMSLDNLLEGVWAEDIINALQNYLLHISKVNSRQLIIASVIIIITSSSAAFRSLANIMEEIQGKPRYKGLLGIIASFIFSLLLLFTIYFSIVMIYTGGWLMETVEEMTGIMGLASIWNWLRFVLLFAVAVVVVHIIYSYSAPKEPGINRLPGAIIATVALVVGSMIFSVIMSASARYSLVYGSLASFILLMIWCYLCGNILIIGNVINYTQYRKSSQNGS